jgi:hypothetical protein
VNVEKMILKDILIFSGRQGSGKSSLQKSVTKNARPKYSKVWELNFADPIYELHNFIQNKIYSYCMEHGMEKTETQLPRVLHDYIFNKMAGWGYSYPSESVDLVLFLSSYVLNRINSNTIHPVSKDGPLLQYLGTEFGRDKFGKQVWVNILKNEIFSLPAWGIENSMVLVGDCRFENEFDAFPEALRIRLECPEEIRKLRTDSWRENTQHPSEIGLDRYSEMGIFDMYCNTSPQGISSDGIASLALAQLDKGNWIEKRIGNILPEERK